MSTRLSLPAHIDQRIEADAAAQAATLGRDVAKALREALVARPQASLLLSGGRSPIPFFQALSSHPLDWSRVVVSLVDERWVPADHTDSNARLVRENLLQGAAGAAQFVPLAHAELSPDDALPLVERDAAALPSPFDVVVLGMGDDAHTASLFPNLDATAAALQADAPPLAAIRPTTAPHARMTFTLPALLRSRLIALQITGANKRRVLESVVGAAPIEAPIAAFLEPLAVPVRVYYAD